ncbi:protein-methionine-sulfoxide reductase catalytic subunit MsrP [Moritella viscosa]
MIIKCKKKSQVSENDVVAEPVYQQRRQFLKQLGLAGVGLAAASPAQASIFDIFDSGKKKANSQVFVQSPLQFIGSKDYADGEIWTPEKKVLSHNNFYEFGTAKTEPQKNAQNFKVEPWTLTITGEVEKEITLGYDDLFKVADLEERIYRMRCVEAWSMVIPWTGFSLAEIINVAFETLYDPQQMPGQASSYLGGNLDWPYVEGLRMDEAMHPLTMLSVGTFGKTLAPQNGAPIRLVVPWKYGFKGIKSIVKIHLLEKEPPTTWNRLAAREYGFYANVNPVVDHPRWSQASERRIGNGSVFSSKRIKTLPFNGYAEEVASLYQGMDLKRYI